MRIIKARFATSSTPTVRSAKRVEYDAFGDPISEYNDVDQLFYFQGQERDAATGLQLHGARWYDPATGRWLSEDPSGFAGGDPNLYRYVGNSPLNATDPSGLTQAGNPLTNLFAGGYSGGKVAAYKPVNQFVASANLAPKPPAVPKLNLAGGLNSYSTVKAVDQYFLDQSLSLSNLANPNRLSAGTFSFTATPTREQIFEAQLNPNGPVTKVQTIESTIHGDKFRRPAAALDSIVRTSNNPLAVGTAQFVKPIAAIAGYFAGGLTDTVFPPSDPTRIVTYRDGTRNLYIGEGPSTGSLADFATLAVGGGPRALPRPAAQPTVAPRTQVNTGVNKVYQSIDETGNVQYVGITNNLERRAAEQLRQKGIEIDAIPGLRNLSRFDAKAVEQVLIDTFGLGKSGGTLLNKINTIATSNPTYTQAIARGREILKIAGIPIP